MSPTGVLTSAAGIVGGRFVVDRLLGRGGMGEVFLALDVEGKRTVALKLLPNEFLANPTLHRRLEREGRLAASLRHPNICAIYDVGHDGSRPFIAMEYVPGETLHDRLARGPMPPGAVIAIAVQLADALEAARQHQIVHRDLKSTNIVVMADGSVKILDFGLATRDAGAMPDDGSMQAADHGSVAGTAEYMSPEQALGRRVDHRSDLFALGAVLYEALTGRVPFSAAATMEVLWKVVNGEPDPIACTTPEARALSVIIVRLLHKNCDARYQTAAALREDLLALHARLQPTSRRRRVSVALLLRPLAGVATGMAFTIGGLIPGTLWFSTTVEAAWTSAAERRTSVWVGDADGNNMTAVVPSAAGAGAVWIGNRGRIIYSVSHGDGHHAIWVMKPGAAGPQLFVDQASQPAVTPDGRTMVFRRDGASPGLFGVETDGTNLRRLLSGEIAHPFVAPDGRTVVFERIGPTARLLWRMSLDGTALGPIATTSPGSRPIIAPDGKRLAFESDAGVIVCSLPDCADEQVLPIGTPHGWTPDGLSLAYVGPPDGANVWTITLATGARRQITHFPDRTVTSLAWSADGRRLAVTRSMTFADLNFMPALTSRAR